MPYLGVWDFVLFYKGLPSEFHNVFPFPYPYPRPSKAILLMLHL